MTRLLNHVGLNQTLTLTSTVSGVRLLRFEKERAERLLPAAALHGPRFPVLAHSGQKTVRHTQQPVPAYREDRNGQG